MTHRGGGARDWACSEVNGAQQQCVEERGVSRWACDARNSIAQRRLARAAGVRRGEWRTHQQCVT
jgi:hypothetical protein